MEFQEKEALISRIQSGVVGFSFNQQRYICREPSAFVKFHANLLYNELIADVDPTELPSLNDIQLILKEKNMWSNELDNELTICSDNIDKLKVAIYESR